MQVEDGEMRGDTELDGEADTEFESESIGEDEKERRLDVLSEESVVVVAEKLSGKVCEKLAREEADRALAVCDGVGDWLALSATEEEGANVLLALPVALFEKLVEGVVEEDADVVSDAERVAEVERVGEALDVSVPPEDWEVHGDTEREGCSEEDALGELEPP